MQNVHRYAASLALACVLVISACDTGRDQAAETDGVVAISAEEEMRSSLASVVDAQASFYEDHGRYAAGTDTLVANYGFAPVGNATVTINFTGTAPEWGYVAAAIHPNTDQQCEVHHGRRGAEGPEFEFAGEIVCRVR